MECHRCGYFLSPIEEDYPRCRRLAEAGIVLPPEAQTGPSEPEDGSEPGPLAEAVADEEQAGPSADTGDAAPSPRAAGPPVVLVPCTLCQHPASPYALQCPSCGHPLTPSQVRPEATKPTALTATGVAIMPAVPKPAAPPLDESSPRIRGAVPAPQAWKAVPTSPPSRPGAAAEFAPRAAPARRVAPVPAGVAPVPGHPARRELKSPRRTHRFPRLPVHVALVAATVLLATWLTVSLLKKPHHRSAQATLQLARASRLIAQADTDAVRFQQYDLTPEQAAASLQGRTAQYREAQRLSQAGLSAGGDRQTGLREQQAAGRGMHQVQADAEAQSARLLTAGVASSIALYKRQGLTDEQAARVRAGLRTECNEALGLCAQALEDDAANAAAWAERVRVLRFLGQAKAADAAIARARALAPDNPLLRVLEAMQRGTSE